MNQWIVVNSEGSPIATPCAHLGEATDPTPSSTHGCTDCLREGTRWLHLRKCLICGHVGCCDQSPRKHATAHFHATDHALIRSFQPDEDWGWCYPDELFLLPAELA